MVIIGELPFHASRTDKIGYYIKVSFNIKFYKYRALGRVDALFMDIICANTSHERYDAVGSMLEQRFLHFF